MKVAIEKTGGLVVLAESFGHSVFKDSFKRIFEDGEQSLGLSFKWVDIYIGNCFSINIKVDPSSFEVKLIMCSKNGV